jgi:hypothetical protein
MKPRGATKIGAQKGKPIKWQKKSNKSVKLGCLIEESVKLNPTPHNSAILM